MDIIEVLDRIGYWTQKIIKAFKFFLFPKPLERPPKIGLKKYTAHETFSLCLQLVFILYLITGVLMIILKTQIYTLLSLCIVSYLIIRFILISGTNFVINVPAYRFFYYGLMGISSVAFIGYSLIRDIKSSLIYLYGFIGGITVVVLAFRGYFKAKFGRDYTYGVVEEVKGDLAKVFVHDDISANVKPGYYWVTCNIEVKPGDLVKIAVENRPLRGAIPKGIIEVLQSSQTRTEPKAEIE
ncbi:hypothetical protein A3L04_07185 [Thermococcus chitonophagus]|uniref:DUF2101 domain-containing protein n=1 Tax=Thermococcus chitonophagus TaxID=54262 RepID=A0A160VTP2_9EURY|nr:DUF2101 family protein [Thermococcus chitonophagus]ASJ16871.1 hypothetical protein A3L04_07185 [Thermococcus chitonophagus]CUX78352.1 hypothetical protein CHITON_1573 [Thermococcus chitonophagus]